MLLCAFGSLVGLCCQPCFSLSALLLLLFVHSFILTDILKGFTFLSTLSFVCIILELLSLFFLSSRFWKMLKQEVSLGSCF